MLCNAAFSCGPAVHGLQQVLALRGLQATMQGIAKHDVIWLGLL